MSNTRETVQALVDALESLEYYDAPEGVVPNAIAAGRALLAQPQETAVPQWQSIESAPKDGTEFLAWFPKVRLDDDDNMTDEVVGGAMAMTSFTGGSWNEPDWLDAHGSFYFEDWCFAPEPTHWHALPAAPSTGTPLE
jgi:hypothetical protein